MRDPTRHRARHGRGMRSSALPGGIGGSALDPAGLLVRGVVVATYVQRAEDGPFPDDYDRVGIYCDVLVYSSHEAVREVLLNNVLVAQPYGGMHEGHVWKPRAARIDVTAVGALDPRLAEPMDLDGDHVLVGFLDGTTAQPVILRAVPHPRWGLGNEDLDVGHRERMDLVDGEPDFWKHRGSYWGVDTAGNFVADLTRAHTGDYAATGEETPADDAGSGGFFARVARAAKVLFSGLDPDGGSKTFELELDASRLKVLVNSGANSLEVTDADGSTLMQVGDGAVHVPIAEHLQALYGQLETAFNTHTHSVPGSGLKDSVTDALISGSATSAPPTSPAPSWDPNINSTKVSIPDG